MSDDDNKDCGLVNNDNDDDEVSTGKMEVVFKNSLPNLSFFIFSAN